MNKRIAILIIILSVQIIGLNILFAAEDLTYSTNSDDSVTYSYQAEDFINPEPDRRWYFPVRIMTGGINFSAGVSYQFTAKTRLTIFGGITLSPEANYQTLATTDFWFGYTLLNLVWFDLTLQAGVVTFFLPERPNAQLAVGFEMQYWKIFLDISARFDSTQPDQVFQPMVGLGIRI